MHTRTCGELSVQGSDACSVFRCPNGQGKLLPLFSANMHCKGCARDIECEKPEDVR